jgi:hypothetical protein
VRHWLLRRAREPVETWIFTVASAEESWRIPFEEQVETRIGDIRPLYAYLRAILARGWLRDDDLRAYW